MTATITELAAWVRQRDDFAIVPHVSPDGDALGSAVALMLAFGQLGKRAQVVSADPVPAMYAFLPCVERVASPDALSFEPDCLLFIDVAAPDRAGDGGVLSARVRDWALLDHHGTNTGFAELSVVDAGAPATGLLALALIDELEVTLTRDMALLLYAAIATDTGNFSYSNTTPASFRAGARLLEVGIDLEDANYRLFRLRTVARTKLLGAALDALELREGGRFALVRIPQSMLDRCGADYAQTEGIINFLSEIEGVDVAMTVESRDGGATTKFSLRSRNGVDVAAIARAFGGGGHVNAAGMNIDAPVDVAAVRAIDAVERAMNA